MVQSLGMGLGVARSQLRDRGSIAPSGLGDSDKGFELPGWASEGERVRSGADGPARRWGGGGVGGGRDAGRHGSYGHPDGRPPSPSITSPS